MRRIWTAIREWLNADIKTTREPGHIGATIAWAGQIHRLADIPVREELQPVPLEVTLLHQVQRELDCINLAVARFSRRMTGLIQQIEGEVEATGELSRHELNRLLNEGRELATR